MMINNKIDRRSLRTFLRALAITFAIISLTTMAFAADVSPISASAKEEIVYGSLTADGEPQAVYIVNYLHLDEAGVFTDYGSYSNVLNLTDGQMLSAANGEVSGTIEAGNEFIYQGKSESNELPWLFVIRYELDGIAVAPAQLAGNSGRIVIRAGAVRNFAVASEYYENCALQASLTLDRERFRNVEANGATLANAGGNIQVTCASLPGSPMYFTVTADVTDFEMDSATIAALPTSMRISPPDTSEWQAQLTQLTDAIASLSQGMANLSSGAQDLSGGASALGVGYASLQSGLDALSAQSSALISGAEQIGGALSSLTAALTSSAEGAAAGLAQLEPLLSGMRTGLTSIESALTQLKSAVSPITDALSQAIVALPAESIAVETIGAIYSAASGFKESLDQLTAGHEAGVRVRAALESTLAGLAQLPQNIDALLSGCQSMIESIDQASLALNPQPTTAPTTPPDEEEAPTLSLPDALAQLNEQYGQFQSAIAAFAQGISSAASGSAQTKLGVDALATGAATLASGIASVSEGASAMNQSVSGLPSEMNARISEMLQAYDKSSYRPTSFADERNGSIRAVQFTLRTDAIRLPQAEPEPVAEEESATFWTRLLKLFRD